MLLEILVPCGSGIFGAMLGGAVVYGALKQKVIDLSAEIAELKQELKNKVLPVLPGTVTQVQDHERRLCLLEGSPVCGAHQVFYDRVEHLVSQVDKLYEVIVVRGGVRG